MTNTATVVEQPTTIQEGLPNKFIYPEFAGFAGEELLHEIVTMILPVALYRTWEIFERKHAYDNDCYQSLGTVTRKASRTQRTINRHIATFLSRRLLVMRSCHKLQRRLDGSMYQKAVIVKDFSGLYALAHEYYLWQRDEEHYLTPEYENLEYIQSNPRLVAKLCRFEDYRRLLERHRDPFARVQEDRRFTDYDVEDLVNDGEGKVFSAEKNNSGSNRTFLPSKEMPKVSQKRINEKAYNNSLREDSFDSDPDQEVRWKARVATRECSQTCTPVAPDYTKIGEKQNLPNESQTNSVPFSKKNIPPSAGRTRESYEKKLDVQHSRDAMAIALGTRPHSQEEPPPKHPLARSFVHEVSCLFGDLNEKGSKTGIERSIETFELEQPTAVLLCLVRAYVVARDTKNEKIRYHHPETGVPNRMPLFCSMFKKFARALASGSPWEYTWQKLLEDVAADDRLSLWLSEHQAELVAPESNQGDTSETHEAQEQEAEAHEEVQETAGLPGWADGADAYEAGERLMQAIVDANYSDIAVALCVIDDRYHVVYKVLIDEGSELVLSSEAEITYLIEQAQLRQL